MGIRSKIGWALATLSLVGCGPLEALAPPNVPEANDRPAPPPGSPVALHAVASHRVIAPGDTQVWIGIWVRAPASAAQAKRPPMNLALVVDTSGSMAGPKIEHARLAATSLIEGLSMGDSVSLDLFSDRAWSLAPTTVVSRDSLPSLMDAARAIQPGGGTNMYDGLRLGEEHAAASRHPVRRMIVISDGQANVGPSSPGELGDLVSQGTEMGVQVSAVGVGLDYDERTLGELAKRTSGRMYHLEEPSQLGPILDQEVRLMASTVATDVEIVIEPRDGVVIDDGAIPGAKRRGSAVVLKLGTLFGEQERELLVPLTVKGARGAEANLINVKMAYADPFGRRAFGEAPVKSRVSADARDVASGEDAAVGAMVARFKAAAAQRRAAELLDKGHQKEAVDVLSGAEELVVRAANKANDPAERKRLNEQAARMSQSKEQYKSADNHQKKRAAALESYGYSFADEGLSAPIKPSVPRPPPPGREVVK